MTYTAFTDALHIATRQPQAHANGAPGRWWAEYRVRPLTDGERNTERTYRYSWVLEQRYCHDIDSEYCAHHDGHWRTLDYGSTAEDAVRSCAGDSHYMEAESHHALHVEMIRAWTRQQRIDRGRQVLFLATHHPSQYIGYGQIPARERDIEAEERERAQEQYVIALKRDRLYTAACNGTAPNDKIQSLKAIVRTEYERRLTERTRRHALMLAKYQQLGGGGVVRPFDSNDYHERHSR